VKRKLSNREKVLIVVLGVAGVIAYRALSGDGIGFGGGAASDAEEARNFGEAPLVRMDLLARTTAEFDRKGRNLFDYYTPPRKVVQQPRPKRPVVQPPPPREVPKPPPPPPTTVARAPNPPFQYLGFLGPKDEKIAVFDDNEDVLLARIGDVVQDGFRLVEFKHDAVMLAYTDQKWQGQTTELKLMGLR
jgi:hypothetical protein